MGAVVAFARVDVRNLGRDPLLVVVGTSPLLLAGALRLGFSPATGWAARTHGLDVAAHDGFVLGLVAVLHVPFIFGMLGALLVLDDRDDRTLLAVRVTPVALDRYLAYRLAAVALASLVGLLVVVPLSGLAAGALPELVPAIVLAAASGPLATLATLSLADNKVEGLAVIKVVGFVAYLPLATWFTDAGWTWGLAVLPTFWPVLALWAGLEGRVDIVVVGVGAAYVAATGVGLFRRTMRRVAT